MSHVRKEIESVIALMVRKIQKFRHGQLGFRQETGTETAMLRHISSSKQIGVAAVLDLNTAYDSVPGRKLFAVIKETMTSNITNMPRLALQPITVRTQGEITPGHLEIAEGICQGSPLSHTLSKCHGFVHTLSQCKTRG